MYIIYIITSQGVDRVVAERGLLPDLEEPPARPLYGYSDK